MALFGFNKQKVLSNAEKYVQQGKLQNAIAEYEKVLKNDAKDLTVTNTVGDLYSRLGETDKATACFKTVGDAYASQGFTVKAIAMYKKICKLQPSLESLLKLAELYSQQGLFNDARAQYLQVAEEFLKASELENAVRIFQKILEMDPENSNMRVRLAEVYVRLGKKTEAWQIFSAAAESLRSKGSLSGAEAILQRMLKLDPGNTYALLMQGKNLIESGDAAGAVAALQKISDIDSHPDGLRDLLKAYLQTGQLSEAGAVASKLLTVHNDLAGDLPASPTRSCRRGSTRMLCRCSTSTPSACWRKIPTRCSTACTPSSGTCATIPTPCKNCWTCFTKRARTTHVSEVIGTAGPRQRAVRGPARGARSLSEAGDRRAAEPPAHAELPAGGQPAQRHLRQQADYAGRSRRPHRGSGSDRAFGSPALFRRGCARRPLGPDRRGAFHLLQHARQGARTSGRSPAAGAQRSSPEPAAGRLAYARRPFCRGRALLPHAAERLPRSRTIPRKLRATANWPSAMRNVPRLRCPALAAEEEHIFLDAPAPEAESAVEEFSCRRISRGRGVAGSSRKLAPKPPREQERFPVAPAAEPAEEITVDPAEPEFAVVDESAASAEAAAAPGEIDLSSEWDDSITVERPMPRQQKRLKSRSTAPSAIMTFLTPARPIETVEEIRFYLAHGMPEQAMAALAKLQTLTSDQAKLDELRAEVEAATAQPADEEAAAEPVVEELYRRRYSDYRSRG